MTTPAHMPVRKRHWLLILIAVCLIAINLRTTIMGALALLDEISQTEGLSPTMAGLLAAVPFFMWGALSPVAQILADRFGLNVTVSYALAGLTVATIWRSLPGSSLNLWLGTLLLGATMAIINVLLPAAIKRDFGSRVPLVMGIYSALISASAAFGAGIVAPVASFETSSGDALGWRWGLLASGAMLPVALLVWILVMKQRRSPAEKLADAVSMPKHQNPARRVWSDPVAWKIALFMGALSANLNALASWISPFQVSLGMDMVDAAFNLMLFQLCVAVGSLSTPLLVRGTLGKLAPILLPLLVLVGAMGYFVAQPILLWLIIMGYANGALFALGIFYGPHRSLDVRVAGASSGMVQSVGYLIGGIGPILFGWLHSLSGDWLLPQLGIILAVVVQVVAAISLWRPRWILPDTPTAAGTGSTSG